MPIKPIFVALLRNPFTESANCFVSFKKEIFICLVPKSVQEQLAARIAQTDKKKPLTEEEKEILSLRKSILSQVNQDQLSKIKNDNIRNLNRNLDYFIVSSEVPTSQKLYQRYQDF